VSAGAAGAATVSNAMEPLAPKFRAAVVRAIKRCNDGGLDAFVFEAFRSAELQAIYFARGRTVFPPPFPVTNAFSNLFSWHGYGLAVDVISRARHWDAPVDWFAAVAKIFGEEGCRWGGDWRQRDLPHFQWGRCKPSPSQAARDILAMRGLPAVWEVVGAA